MNALALGWVKCSLASVREIRFFRSEHKSEQNDCKMQHLILKQGIVQRPIDTCEETMFTATPTIPNVYNPFPRAQFSTRVNPETSFIIYSRYRDMAMGLIDTNSTELFYRVYNNALDSFNGQGMHEKFIYRGRSVLDLSVGLLDFPWFAADSNPINEITGLQLQQMANNEQVPLVAWRLRQIANFAATLPPYTRYYYYMGVDGTRAITIEDEFNAVKFSCILTFVED